MLNKWYSKQPKLLFYTVYKHKFVPNFRNSHFSVLYFGSVSIILATSCFVLGRVAGSALLVETSDKVGNVYVMNGLGVEMLLGNSHNKIPSPSWPPGSISQVLGDWFTFHGVFADLLPLYKTETMHSKQNYLNCSRILI